jgi:pimeloyl-ACP methyl ester carboxylesterase
VPHFNVNGIDLYCELAGSGEPLLLLHGLGSSSLDWDEQIGVYAEHFRVIAPDLRGFGRSSKPIGPYSIRLFGEDLTALLDRLKISRCHVLGYSMGGAIALQMATHPESRFSSLILVNTLASFEVDHWRKQMFVLVRIAMARFVGMERMARFGAKRLFPDPHQSHLRRRMIERHRHNTPHSYLAALHALKGWTVKELLPRIDVPTLVVAADQDYFSVEEKAEFVAAMPNARLEIVTQSRHGTPFDQSERFNKLVMAFLFESMEPSGRAPWWRRLGWPALGPQKTGSA